MVDPALAQSANVNAIRPPSRPDTGAVPPDGIGARADTVDAASLKSAPPAKDCPQLQGRRGAP